MKTNKMHLITILIVILVVAGVAGYYYEVEYKLPPLPLNTTTLPSTDLTSENTQYHLRALYYDSLYREYPNDTLVALIVTTLESHGYDVNVYLGRNATLDQLVNMQSYDLVIIRAHGGYSNKTAGAYLPGEYIFTGLYYNESLERYGESVVSWIKKGYLALGVIPPPGRNLSKEELEKLPKYLVVGPKFIEENMLIKKGSVFIVFGCYTFQDGTLAKILLNKGAKAYVGWQEGVTPKYMDKVLPGIIEVYLKGNLGGLQKYVNSTTHDPYSGGTLKILVNPK